MKHSTFVLCMIAAASAAAAAAAIPSSRTVGLEPRAMLTENAQMEEESADEREIKAEYSNFIVYSARYDDPDVIHGFWYETEIVNRQTGAVLLSVPSIESVSNEGYINSFFLIDDDTLLWSKYAINAERTAYQWLKADGTLQPVEAEFNLISQDSRGRFIAWQLDQSGKKKYGIVDRNLKTILLPIEYENDFHFDDGYAVLQKNGKYGIMDFNLKMVQPFQYDHLEYRLYHTFRFWKNEKPGVLFIESGTKIPNVEPLYMLPHTVSAHDPDWTVNMLYDRTGSVLYISKDSISNDKEPVIEVNQAVTEIPAMTATSGWAQKEVAAARAAELIPADVELLYTKPITRRDFCKLAMQLIKIARPSVYDEATSKAGASFWDVTTRDFTDETMIGYAVNADIISGLPDGSFHPYAQITRQDAAVILARTAKALGVQTGGDALAFTDLDKAGAYARDAIQMVSALQTADGTHVMTGTGANTFDPLGRYTTEQAIATMYRLYRAGDFR